MKAPTALLGLTQEGLIASWLKADEKQKKTFRLLAQTDLFFLAKVVLNYRDLVPHVHGPMCDLFISKDASKSIPDQDEIKERLLLSPRGCFKTTIDIADIVQWIITFPEITILILSGAQDLAEKMVHEVRFHFINNEAIRLMFPECCLPVKEDYRKQSYENPYRKAMKINKREPTLEMSTVLSVKAGSHYDLIKGDDIVHENNSGTAEQLAKAKEAIDATRFLLNPGGYFDFIGTRYDHADAYGRLLEFSSLEDDESTLKTLIQQAWTVKPGVELAKNRAGLPLYTEDTVDLLFPERLPFKLLNREYRRNPQQFFNQRMNDPTIGSETTIEFDIGDIQRHCIPYTQLPKRYSVFCQWDLSGSNPSSKNDRTVGITGYIDENNSLYIVDMMLGQWNASIRAQNIVSMACANQPKVTFIEDANGAKDLQFIIEQYIRDYKQNVPIQWKPAPRIKNGKQYRIGMLNQLLKRDKLWFCLDEMMMQEVTHELVNYGRQKRDDIPDCMAQLVQNALVINGNYVDLAPQMDEQKIRDALFYKMLFEETAQADSPEPQQEYGPLGYGY